MKKLFLLIVIFASSSNPIFSQAWLQQTSPVTTDLNGAWACNEQVCWMCGPSGIVIRTTNGGTTWDLANNGLAGNDFYTISALNANNCIIGAGDGGLWRTTNGGANWTLIILTPPAVFMNVVHFFNSNEAFAMSDPSGGSWKYYISTNGGSTWAPGPVNIPAIGIEAGWNNAYTALDTSFIIWGTTNNRIYKGSFRGSWSPVTTLGNVVRIVSFNTLLNGAAFFGTGVYRTTDGGTSWINTGFNPAGNPYAMKGVQNTGYMWIGASTNIYRSTNNGASFTSQFTLPAGSSCYALTFVYQLLGWAGTQGGKIFRYFDWLGIDPNNNGVPQSYSLHQNYPNPFNPSTTIKYALPNSSFVSLNIYDALGNLVKSVVNGNQVAGNYIENVDMSSFASGIYFYSLKAGNFTETKKMTLIK